ncbi:MAG: hypothetical protein WDN45_02810 [Caulobacteraceae bacterium]
MLLKQTPSTSPSTRRPTTAASRRPPAAPHAQKITQPEEVAGAIAAALKAIREEKRSAVIDVWLP